MTRKQWLVATGYPQEILDANILYECLIRDPTKDAQSFTLSSSLDSSVWHSSLWDCCTVVAEREWTYQRICISRFNLPTLWRVPRLCRLVSFTCLKGTILDSQMLIWINKTVGRLTFQWRRPDQRNEIISLSKIWAHELRLVRRTFVYGMLNLK
jgi:hypothetical protein